MVTTFYAIKTAYSLSELALCHCTKSIIIQHSVGVNCHICSVHVKVFRGLYRDPVAFFYNMGSTLFTNSSGKQMS